MAEYVLTFLYYWSSMDFLIIGNNGYCCNINSALYDIKNIK